jgi:hypothetical protein
MMLDDMNRLGDAAQPERAPAATTVAHEATKAHVARALPAWHSQRAQLRRDRVRRRETVRFDAQVVAFVRGAGMSLAIGTGGLVGWLTYLGFGPTAGFAAGVGGLVVAMAAVSAAVVSARKLFDRSERARREATAVFDAGIHQLDERISRAYLDHGLVGRAPVRSAF